MKINAPVTLESFNLDREQHCCSFSFIFSVTIDGGRLSRPRQPFSSRYIILSYGRPIELITFVTADGLISKIFLCGCL